MASRDLVGSNIFQNDLISGQWMIIIYPDIINQFQKFGLFVNS